MSSSEHGVLGQNTVYEFSYNPELLFPIARVQGRQLLGIAEQQPFIGVDRWTAYEFSWLNPRGVPQVNIVHFEFSSASRAIVESKSFKLYLNSFNQTRFASEQEVVDVLKTDLSHVAGDTVLVEFQAVDKGEVDVITAACIDNAAVSCDVYLPDARLLKIGATVVDRFICSHVFRSLCPVTGQPDWASIFIDYKGAEIIEGSLLQYLVSYRQHQGFHEQCIEEIFCDIWRECQPHQLTVYGRFMRRGGLDINPLRSSHPFHTPILRVARQ